MGTDLVARLERAASRHFAAAPVRFGYLFGSRAHGYPRPDSDVDVAIHLGGALDPGAAVDLAVQLGVGLTTELRAEVDLVVLDHAPLPLVGRVLQGRIVIYSVDEPARVRFESQRLREFLDFQIRAEPLDRLLLTEIAAGRR